MQIEALGERESRIKQKAKDRKWKNGPSCG